MNMQTAIAKESKIAQLANLEQVQAAGATAEDEHLRYCSLHWQSLSITNHDLLAGRPVDNWLLKFHNKRLENDSTVKIRPASNC
jgi:hypothetical protein